MGGGDKPHRILDPFGHTSTHRALLGWKVSSTRIFMGNGFDFIKDFRFIGGHQPAIAVPPEPFPGHINAPNNTNTPNATNGTNRRLVDILFLFTLLPNSSAAISAQVRVGPLTGLVP